MTCACWTDLTVLAALKAQVQYPLPESFFLFVMIKRGLEDVVCTETVSNSSAFKGAMADCLKQIVFHPNSISEGGISISKAEVASIKAEANRLYREIGEEPIGGEVPKITFY